MSFKQPKYKLFFFHPLSVFTTVMFLLFLSDNMPVEPVETAKPTDAVAGADELILPQAELASSEGFIIIPIKVYGRLLMVDAEIDGQSGNLIFDTGATDIVLNSTYFRKYITVNSQTSKGITGSVNKIGNINLTSLKISDLELKKFQATLADLGHIENSRGVKVLGLFGFEMFKNFETIIDVSRQQLQLYRIDTKGNRINTSVPGFTQDYSRKIEVSKNILFVKGMIAGKELRFCLDTGAETNVISSRSGKSVMNTITITNKSKLQGVGSLQPEVLIGTMSELRFGDQDLSPMQTIVSNLEGLSEAYEMQTDGILGYEFLKKGTISINFVKKQIGIIYNKK
jgi:hypothetical protein